MNHVTATNNLFKLLLKFLILLPLSFLINSNNAHALVIEDLIDRKELLPLLQNKKIGYYIGSFDPLHKGHENVINLILKRRICDYILIYPSWGNDSFKSRTNLELRLQMIFKLYESHKKILVTKLPPYLLQKELTLLNPETHNRIPKPPGARFIGILGSDVALNLKSDLPAAKKFMSGLTISRKYKFHTWGGCIALPVDSFIVYLRGEDKPSVVQSSIAQKPVTILQDSTKKVSISSTFLKETLKNGGSVDDMVESSVMKIIKENKLYEY